MIPSFDGRARFARVKVVKPHRLCGDNWTRLRNRWIKHHPFCEHCKGPAQEVHHIIPRSVRPDLVYDVNNLMSLCIDCHRAHHRVFAGKKPRF